MTLRPRCPACKRQVEDGLLCIECTNELEDLLDQMPALLADLNTTLRRGGKTSRATVHRPDPLAAVLQNARTNHAPAIPAMLRSRHEAPPVAIHALPVDLTAAAVAHDTRRLLIRAVTQVRERAPRDQAVDALPAARWLHARVEHMRGWDAAPRLLRDLRAARNRIHQVIDNRAAERYLGRCEAPDVKTGLTGGHVTIDVDTTCGAHMYAHEDAAEVDCPICGSRYNVTDRRAYLVDSIRDSWARPRDIADALTQLDRPLTANQLDVWISRDRRELQAGRAVQDPDTYRWYRLRDNLPLIIGDDVDTQGRKLPNAPAKPEYRICDVLDRLDAVAAKKQGGAA